jgi:hypothetical protein
MIKIIEILKLNNLLIIIHSIELKFIFGAIYIIFHIKILDFI